MDTRPLPPEIWECTLVEAQAYIRTIKVWASEDLER